MPSSSIPNGTRRGPGSRLRITVTSPSATAASPVGYATLKNRAIRLCDPVSAVGTTTRYQTAMPTPSRIVAASYRNLRCSERTRRARGSARSAISQQGYRIRYGRPSSVSLGSRCQPCAYTNSQMLPARTPRNPTPVSSSARRSPAWFSAGIWRAARHDNATIPRFIGRNASSRMTWRTTLASGADPSHATYTMAYAVIAAGNNTPGSRTHSRTRSVALRAPAALTATGDDPAVDPFDGEPRCSPGPPAAGVTSCTVSSIRYRTRRAVPGLPPGRGYQKGVSARSDVAGRLAPLLQVQLVVLLGRVKRRGRLDFGHDRPVQPAAGLEPVPRRDCRRFLLRGRVEHH